MLASHGLLDDASGRSRYCNYIKRRIAEIQHRCDPKEADEQWSKIRSGWAFGSDEFRQKVQDAIDKAVSGKHRSSFIGEEIRTHDEQEAEKLFQQGLMLCGLSEKDLVTFMKGDDRKKVIALPIRKHTRVRVGWIAQRLQMGAESNFSRYIRAVEQSTKGALWELKCRMTI